MVAWPYCTGRGQPPAYGRCPVCGKRLTSRQDGTVRLHTPKRRRVR